jgi:hypothetical protein
MPGCDHVQWLNAGVAAVSSFESTRVNRYCYVTSSTATLQKYLGHTVTAMSHLLGSTQLTLHLQSPAAAAAAQQAAEEAAAAAEAAATWQVYQVCHLQKELIDISNRQLGC